VARHPVGQTQSAAAQELTIVNENHYHLLMTGGLPFLAL
jgi:hypothetical protein